jgi:hypothetical protein
VSVGATNRGTDDEVSHEILGTPVRTAGMPARSSISRSSSRPRTSAASSGTSPCRESTSCPESDIKQLYSQSSTAESQEPFSPDPEKRPSIVAINKVGLLSNLFPAFPNRNRCIEYLSVLQYKRRLQDVHEKFLQRVLPKYSTVPEFLRSCAAQYGGGGIFPSNLDSF